MCVRLLQTGHAPSHYATSPHLHYFTLEYIFDVTLVFLAHTELQNFTAGHIMQCCKPAIRQGEALVRGDYQTPKGLGRAQCGMCSFAFGGKGVCNAHCAYDTDIFWYILAHAMSCIIAYRHWKEVCTVAFSFVNPHELQASSVLFLIQMRFSAKRKTN